MSTRVQVNGTDTLFLGDVPARDLGLPQCGEFRSRWYPTGCTKVAGHGAGERMVEHGHPNWEGRIEIARTPILPGFQVRTSHSHATGLEVRVRTRQDADDLIALIQEYADLSFGVSE